MLAQKNRMDGLTAMGCWEMGRLRFSILYVHKTHGHMASVSRETFIYLNIILNSLYNVTAAFS